MSEKKPKIISIANQKGGVAKTTTSVNLAASLAIKGNKVLIIDLDPQGNASTGVGLPLKERSNTIYDVLINGTDIREVCYKTSLDGLEIVPANINLSAAEIELLNHSNKEFILQKAISALGNFDYIIIDCPPSLGQLTLNALTAANALIIPMQCEFYALEGLTHLLKTVDIVQKNLNKELKILGIVLSMYDKRNKLTEQVEEDVRGYLGELVFENVIPRNVRISEAPSHGMSVLIYDPNCSGSKAYTALSEEVSSRI